MDDVFGHAEDITGISIVCCRQLNSVGGQTVRSIYSGYPVGFIVNRKDGVTSMKDSFDRHL